MLPSMRAQISRRQYQCHLVCKHSSRHFTSRAGTMDQCKCVRGVCLTFSLSCMNPNQKNPHPHPRSHRRDEKEKQKCYLKEFKKEKKWMVLSMYVPHHSTAHPSLPLLSSSIGLSPASITRAPPTLKLAASFRPLRPTSLGMLGNPVRIITS